MKVKIGEYEKLIPKRYALAVTFINPDDLEEPNKKRLTPMERFMFAEGAWRLSQRASVLEYLDGMKPEQSIIQTNRDGDVRYSVRYKNKEGKYAITVVPTWVFSDCPDDRISQEYAYWHR